MTTIIGVKSRGNKLSTNAHLSQRKGGSLNGGDRVDEREGNRVRGFTRIHGYLTSGGKRREQRETTG